MQSLKKTKQKKKLLQQILYVKKLNEHPQKVPGCQLKTVRMR